MICEQPEPGPAAAAPVDEEPAEAPPPAAPLDVDPGAAPVEPLCAPAEAWPGDAAPPAVPPSAAPPAPSPVPLALSPGPVEVRAVRVTVVQPVVRAMRNSDSATTVGAVAARRRRRLLVWRSSPLSRPEMVVNGLSPAREFVASITAPGTPPPRPRSRSGARRCPVLRSGRS